ncbi:MAG TPA: trehalase family glycosidase [Alphaproteobacteria bacterium]|nr:trehalase family glycosidase [Alphaproteobacteria bacterium]
MIGTDIVPAERAWNSWDSDHPAAMRYLPLGLELRPCTYAASRNDFTDYPAGAPGLSLGQRRVTADGVWLRLAHAGTELELRYTSPDPTTLIGRYRVLKHGEWGLRFWVVLALRLMAPERAGASARWRFDPRTGFAQAVHRRWKVAVGASRRPLLVTAHSSLAALREEMQSKGYWYLDSRSTSGTLLALRYNLEEMPGLTFVATVAADPGTAVRRVGETLSRLQPSSPASGEGWSGGGSRDQSADPLAAVRDVITWNTVWDPVNHRPYTTLSRNWGMQKFGGWGVWLDDLFFHALMASAIDPDLARENLEAALGNATPEGNLACLITGRDAWLDRSQPPIGSFIVWLLHTRLGSRELLRRAWPVLDANHRWWLARRDGNGDGLYEYGSSDIGAGLYIGTKLAAKDESFMDNSPVHDEAEFDLKTRTLNAADVGLNSLIALDAEMLALIAEVLGKKQAARRHAESAEALKARIAERLWDGERQVFANRLWSGRFVCSLAPTSFFPLLAGAARPEQASAMVRLLGDPRKFGGEWLLPSVTRDDPAFADNVYWRGRIWPPLNFLVWAGLRRAGFMAEASLLAENGWRLFRRAWADRKCPENYSATTGEAFDQPDTDSFYGWGALMPFIALGERIDVTPWWGWSVARGKNGERSGPVCSPWGGLESSTETEAMTLSIDGQPRLITSVERLTGLSFDADAVKAELPPGPAAWIAVPAGDGLKARLDGSVLAGRREGNRLRYLVPKRSASVKLELVR